MSAITRSHKIRCYPNAAQVRMLNSWFGSARWVWNHALNMRTKAYQRRKEMVTGIAVSSHLTKLKKLYRFNWLTRVPATCLIQTLRDQDLAFTHFFRRVKSGMTPGYPRFRSRHDHAQSLRFQDVSASNWGKGIMSLPKLGAIKLAEHLPIIECPDMVTLRREADGRYYVSFMTEATVRPLATVASTIGIDLGLTHIATLSTGEKVQNPRKHAGKLRYLRQQQRCLRRRHKGSKRYEKQRLRVARAHSAVANQRSYALHALTTRLVREHQIICIEDLSVQNMIQHPRLARHIADASWGEIRRQLTYKCAWYGRTLVVVDRWYPSSKTCSCCGHKLDELRPNQRKWTCTKCGATHGRDHNAAMNVLAEGLRQLAPGEPGDLRADGKVVNSPREARTGQIA